MSYRRERDPGRQCDRSGKTAAWLEKGEEPVLPGEASFRLYCLSHKTLAAGLGIVRVEKEMAQLLRKARWGDM